MARRTLRLVGLAAVAVCVSGSERARLFDGPSEIRPLGGGSVPLVERLADDLHVVAGEKRSMFYRGLTLAPGEEIRFTIGRSGALRVLRWIEVPGPGEAWEGPIQVLVEGRASASREIGRYWRAVDVPTDARRVRFRASRKGSVRFGEPIITRKAGKTDKPDVLLITVDTMRRDTFSLHGGHGATTPGMEWFARDAFVFADAVAPSSWTLPSFAGLFTGRHPEVLGTVLRSAGIPPGARTLAEALAEAGYHTHAITQNIMLSPDGGFARGFDTYDFYASSDEEWLRAREVTDSALAWLETAPSSPTFLWLHYFDPHSDYAPSPDDAREFDASLTGEHRFKVPSPTDAAALHAVREDPAEVGRARALYLGEVRGVDREISRLLDRWEESGRGDNTMVVITSDHGEEFLEHDHLGHGHSVFEEAIRVPLVLRLPGLRPDSRWISSQVTLLDVALTLAEFAEVDLGAPGEPFAGRSLRAALLGSRFESRPELSVAGLFPGHPGPGFAIRDGRRKWTFATDPHVDRVLVYDLLLDPTESSPRAETDAHALRRVREAWAAMRKASLPREARATTEDALRSLGYAR